MGGTAVSKPKPREFRPQEVTYTSTFTIVYSTDAAGRNTYRLATPAAPMAKGEAVAVTIDRNPDAAGWDFIRFTADEALLSRDQAEAYYAAGYAEGLLTADSIYSSFVTAMSQDGDPHLDVQMNSTESRKWLDAHLKFMRDLSSKNTTRYGVMVKSLLRQIDGMHAGYNAAVKDIAVGATDSAKPLSWTEMFYLSFQSEMATVAAAASYIYGKAPNATNVTNSSSHPTTPVINTGTRSSTTHCSALIRATGDDIFVGHDTWSSFNTMVRQYKTYALAGTVTMSGYPGSLSSIDDWYMTGAKLAVTETSIDPRWVNATEERAMNLLIKPDTVSEFMRVMISNFLATSAPEWAALFSERNSGTYCNQFVILDTNLAVKRLSNVTGVYHALDNNTLWLVEQSVGLVVARDGTKMLNEQHYIAMYDVPYSELVYNRSGYASDGPLREVQEGHTRARLFKRLVPSVTNLETMYALMRYNNYETDPESVIPCAGKTKCTKQGSSMRSIAPRGDLAPLGLHGAFIGRANYAAIDTKVTSVRMMQQDNNSGVAINGPTATRLPPFNLTKFILDNKVTNTSTMLQGVAWRGVPTYFVFPAAKFVHVVRTNASDAAHKALLKREAESIVARVKAKRALGATTKNNNSTTAHASISGPLMMTSPSDGRVAPELGPSAENGSVTLTTPALVTLALCACVAVFAAIRRIRRRSSQVGEVKEVVEGYAALL